MPDLQQITQAQATEALQRMAEAGADAEDIRKAAEEWKPRIIPDTPRTPTLLDAERAMWEKHPTLAGLARGATSTLPFAGAILGGAVATPADLVGGPVPTIVGGAGGAAVGMGAQDLINEGLGLTPVSSPLSKALRMGSEGGIVAATGGVLAGLTAGPRAVARRVGRLAEFVGDEGLVGSKFTNVPALRVAGTKLRQWGGAPDQAALEQRVLGLVTGKSPEVQQAILREQSVKATTPEAKQFLNETRTRLLRENAEAPKAPKVPPAPTPVQEWRGDTRQLEQTTRFERSQALRMGREVAKQEKDAVKLARERAAAARIDEAEAAGLEPQAPSLSETVSAQTPSGRKIMTIKSIKPEEVLSPEDAQIAALEQAIPGFKAANEAERLRRVIPPSTPAVVRPEGSFTRQPPSAIRIAPATQAAMDKLPIAKTEMKDVIPSKSKSARGIGLPLSANDLEAAGIRLPPGVIPKRIATDVLEQRVYPQRGSRAQTNYANAKSDAEYARQLEKEGLSPMEIQLALRSRRLPEE